METELNPGDRVHWIGRPGTFVVEPLAQHRVQIRSEQEGTIFTPLASELTRISPDVPLFRVGQRVAIKNGQKDHLEIAEIEYHYRLRCLPHNAGLDGEIEFKGGLTHCTYSEADLGAVPDEVVCPTCGGKVADG